ncbi:MAG: macro domain-containing protein [Candidatus Bathyarchaeota archaeon]|nr:macro domain-containing protein [Candidatus Bathyarchaeota archaeon]
MEVSVGDTVIRLVRGDITELRVDAIVNAANGFLRLGGGVAGAIRRKGGPEIESECERIIAERGRIPVGEAVITTGGKLKAKYVIHAVGPIYGEGNEDLKLKSITTNCLRLADKHKLRSIAFPAISTGYFGVPKKICAESMLSAALSYVKAGTDIEEIVFCLYDDETLNIFKETFNRIVGGTGTCIDSV